MIKSAENEKDVLQFDSSVNRGGDSVHLAENEKDVLQLDSSEHS